MKFMLAAVIGIAGAWAREAVNPVQPALTICMSPGSQNGNAFYVAKATVNRILADARVNLLWRSSEGSCLTPEGGIVVRVNTWTRPSEHPGALAYATPFKRTDIVLYYDRIRDVVQNKDRMGTILGHVLAHEIVHLLQGVARHSANGLMKPHWDPADFSDMQYDLILPAEEDIDLIRRGLTNWTWNAGASSVK